MPINLNLDNESIKTVIGYIIQYFGWLLAVLIFICALFYPERFEKFAALVLKGLSKIFNNIPIIKKKYIQYDFQSRANSFVNNFLKNELKDFRPMKLKVEWVEDGNIPKSFFDEGKLIVRMRKDDDENKNFVNAAMVFIAENLLIKAKKYISKEQKESIDLFTGKKMFEKEKEELVKQFIEDYLHPKIEDEKIDDLFSKFESIDESGLFFPVFIQEMTFLGEKVFNKRKDDLIFKEVLALVNFLNNYSERKLKEEVENKFLGNYCKFGIIIIGKSDKIYDKGCIPYQTYVKFYRNSNVETLYLIGDIKNKEFIKDFVCTAQFLKEIDFEIFNEKEYYNKICNDKTCWTVKSYLLVIRNNKIKHYHREAK